jgi:SRSO17 transposase
MQDQQVAAAAIVEDGRWLGRLQGELRALLAPVFCRAGSRLTAFAYLGALLSGPGDGRSCWQLAEAAGHAAPRRMQALPGGHARDWKTALAALQRFILDQLADPEAVLVLDETAGLKQGQMTAGVSRRHAGITGQTGNCRAVVFMACGTARAHAFSDFRPCLPKAWCEGERRRRRAQVPRGVAVKAKTRQGSEMVADAISAGAPSAWAAGDEGCGRAPERRAAGEQAGQGYVFAVPSNFQVRLPSGRKAAVAAVAGLVPKAAPGDPRVRAGLQGPPRLPPGPGGDGLAAAPGADPPRHP